MDTNAAAKVAAAKMPIDCYYLPPSPPCRAVMLTAKLVGVELNLKVCNIMEGDHMKEDFLKLNPTHTIPTIIDNGFVLWESRSIMAYLANQYGADDKLYPTDAQARAIVDQRLYFDMSTLYKCMSDYYFPTIHAGAPLDEEKLKKLEEAMALFETLLQGKSYSAGDHLTIADVSLCVTVSNIDAFGMSLSPYPNIKRWYDKVRDDLVAYSYEEINTEGAKMLADIFKAKLGST